MHVLFRRALLAATLSTFLVACGDKTKDLDVLAYVPADTPYVMANRIATPKAINEAWAKAFGGYSEQAYQQMAEGELWQGLDGDSALWVRALLPEVGKFATPAGIAELGLNPEARFALYGFGLMPVYRIEIGDAQRFAATIARVEERAGRKLATRTLDKVSFYEFSSSKATFLFGLAGEHLVITLAPSSSSDDQWRAQLGLTLPKQSLHSQGALEKLDKERQHTGHISGFVNIQNLVQRLTAAGADQELLRAFGMELPEISASCQQEMAAMAAKFPRAVFGSKELSAKSMAFVGTLETETTLARSMQALAAPIPGADATDPTLFRFAMSVNLPEAMRFANAAADAIRAQPYACEGLVGLNAAADGVKEGTANPALAMAGSVSAVNLGLADLQLDDNDSPTAMTGYVAVGSSAPMMLWGLAQQSTPGLASVQLSSDGKIVTLPADALPTPFPITLKARMTDKSFGVATSDVADAVFETASTVPAAADGTMLRYGVSGAAFAMLAERIPDAPDSMNEKERKDMEQGREMLKSMGQAVDFIDVRIVMGERGIDYVQTMRLK